MIGFGFTLRPLVLAPALDAFTGSQGQPATGLSDLTLNNIGPTLAALLHLDPADPIKMGLHVAGLFLLITVAVALLSLGSQILLAHTQLVVQRDMLVALHAHLLTLPLGYFHKHRAGELVSRLTIDVGRVSGASGRHGPPDPPVHGSGRPHPRRDVPHRRALHARHPHDGIGPPAGDARPQESRLPSSPGAWPTARAISEPGSSRRSSGIRAIKSFAAERHESRQVRAVADAYRRAARRARIVGEVDIPIRLVADALVAAVVLVITFHAVSRGRLTLQAAALFFYLSQQFLGPLSIIFRQGLTLAATRGTAARILDMFATQSGMPDGTVTAGPLQRSIVLDAVSFAHEPGRPVLSDVTLEIRRGETVAIVGPSGSGKTTLGDLILRLFDVSAGAIRYDGTDVRDFTQASYRGHFGVVAQDALLFNATVRDNVVFHRPVDPEALAHAIWAANAEEFVRELPQGLDTVLGDRGVRLSGGQRQRIAIARAIYARPSLLVLDEATSALDSEAEREVQKAIERIGREMTIVVIAHRLSTIVHADRIVVLNRGRVEAVGPHSHVLEASPTYRRLHALQTAATPSA